MSQYFPQYCPAWQLSVILLYFYMSLSQRSVCDCNKRILYCIVKLSIIDCPALSHICVFTLHVLSPSSRCGSHLDPAAAAAAAAAIRPTAAAV